MPGPNDLTATFTLIDEVSQPLNTVKKKVDEVGDAGEKAAKKQQSAFQKALVAFGQLVGGLALFKRALDEIPEAKVLKEDFWESVKGFIKDAIDLIPENGVANFFGDDASERRKEALIKQLESVNRLLETSGLEESFSERLGEAFFGKEQIKRNLRSALETIRDEASSGLAKEGIRSILRGGFNITAPEAQRISEALSKALASGLSKASRETLTRDIDFIAQYVSGEKGKDLADAMGVFIFDEDRFTNRFGQAAEKVRRQLAAIADADDFTNQLIEAGFSPERAKQFGAELFNSLIEGAEVISQPSAFQQFKDGFQDVANQINDIRAIGQDVAQALGSSFESFFFQTFESGVIRLQDLLRGLLSSVLRVLSGIIGNGVTAAIGSTFGAGPTATTNSNFQVGNVAGGSAAATAPLGRFGGGVSGGAAPIVVNINNSLIDETGVADFVGRNRDKFVAAVEEGVRRSSRVQRNIRGGRR